MRYMLWMVGDGREEPAPAEIDAMPEFIAWREAVEERGVPHRGARLRPPDTAVTVRVREGEVLLSDGPFADTKEHIGGVEIIEVPDLDVAIEVASKHPAAHQTVEIRPFADATEDPSLVGPPAPVPPGMERFMMFVCVEPGAPAEGEDGVTIGQWLAETERRGVRLEGDVLAHRSDATTIRDYGRLITDGPFADTKEWIGGYDVLDCRGLDEAIEIAAMHPMARAGLIEVRPFWSE
jgi:hypothetical protein